MKTILTFGVFDMLHVGHILLFKHAKELFPDEQCKLMVAVQSDDYIKKYKPDAHVICSMEERTFVVQSIRFVDCVVPYNDVDVDIQKLDFDVFAKGPDQCHAGFKRAVQWCEIHGKQVVTIPRTEGVSSSMLKSINF